jgi:hypothetical protein
VTFAVLPDSTMPITVAGRLANIEYRRKQMALARQITEAVDAATAARTKTEAIIRVLNEMPSASRALHEHARSIDQRLAAFLRAVRGDDVNAARGEQVPVSIQAHIRNASPSGTLSPPSKTEVEQYEIAAAAFPPEYAKLKPVLVTELPALDKELEKLGAPPTPGRIPDIGP